MALRENKGFHPILDTELPYTFVDSCMQIWPDADYPNAHRHGVTAYCVTAWRPHSTLEQALEKVMYWHLVARNYDNIILATTVEDIRRARREGKAALVMASQDATCIGYKLHRVEMFYRLGVRMLIFAYNRTNQLCDGCADRTDMGLTAFGQLVVDECNRVGMLIDCTHIGKRASLEIIERSQDPVIFSHSNPRGVTDNPRNIDDEQIKACVAKGGVIGLAPWGPLVWPKGSPDWPTLERFLDHIDYVVQLTGSTDHIGIGTDMSLGTYPDHVHDPWGEPTYQDISASYDTMISGDVRSPMRAVDGFNAYPEVVNLIEGLQRRGYSDEDVTKILGENHLRLFERVWK